jgi:SAM-dependent methyltransferase
VERFERLYEESPDPWDYGSSEYEREKYAATLAAIGPGPYGRALEVGCSIGIFTEMLTPRCERLVAMDFSPRAIALASERLQGRSRVELLQGSFPEEVPAGRWDLVVCSEVLYYLDSDTFLRSLEWLRSQVSQGTRVVAVSWRGGAETEPLRGDWVHDLLTTELGRWHALDVRQSGYRLDRFDGLET